MAYGFTNIRNDLIFIHGLVILADNCGIIQFASLPTSTLFANKFITIFNYS